MLIYNQIMNYIGIGEVNIICDYMHVLPKELTILIIEYNYTILNKRPYKNIVRKDSRKQKIIHKPLHRLVNNIDVKQSIIPIHISDYILDLCETHELSLKIKKYNTRERKSRRYKKPIKKICNDGYNIKYMQNNIYVQNDIEFKYCTCCGTYNDTYNEYDALCEHCLIDHQYDSYLSDYYPDGYNYDNDFISMIGMLTL